ncbi:MAG: T9SS type A sorting domain-containing protein [Ignavibacteriales bacterium]|nr:T9SS type A sorting domain-containing protein [Ignavibacteriales bacterium]
MTVIPVELTSFTASDSENESKLEWTTATEINNQGFEVQRKTSVGDFAAVGFIEGKGTTTEQHNYSFIDKSLSEGKYSYRLKQIDFDGSFEYSKTIEVEIHNPLKFSLSQNYPNPFNPSTKISWQSPVAGWQTLKIYDVLGNLVTTLVDEYKPAGSYEVEFKSTVGSHQLANGVYFYQLRTGDFVETKKMILLK